MAASVRLARTDAPIDTTRPPLRLAFRARRFGPGHRAQAWWMGASVRLARTDAPIDTTRPARSAGLPGPARPGPGPVPARLVPPGPVPPGPVPF
jgi:hypothetical protein